MTVIDLEPATNTMAALLRDVPDGPLDPPTPAGYSLGDLVDHIRQLTLAFTDAACKKMPESGEPTKRGAADASQLRHDWRETIPHDLVLLAEAWRDPAAYEGMTQAGGIDMPGEVCALVVLEELVLHAWDLARATGQPYEPDPGLVQSVHGFVSQFSGPGQEAAREGMFGPEVDVPEDAPLFDRLLGLAGRDPSWSRD